jgi:hypothetical protein
VGEADGDVSAVVGEGGVCVNDGGEGGIPVIGESCRCSTSSHSPISSSASHLRLAAFLLCLAGGGEREGRVGHRLAIWHWGEQVGAGVPVPMAVNRSGLSLQPVSV